MIYVNLITSVIIVSEKNRRHLLIPRISSVKIVFWFRLLLCRVFYTVSLG